MSTRVSIMCSLVAGLSLASCASDRSGEQASGDKNDQDAILTRIMEREDGTVRVVMKRFEDEGLLRSAKAVMVGKDEFGRVSLDDVVLDVWDEMYKEDKATLVSDNSDITDTSHIYVHVDFSDEKGTRRGTVMGKRDHEPTGNFAPLDFVFESLCDTYHIELFDTEGIVMADKMVTMKEFVDPELHESAEQVLIGADKKRFGKEGAADNKILDPIVNVRKRMFRETEAISISDKADVTDRNNLYVVVEHDNDDGSNSRGVILGRRGASDRDKFIGVQWAYTDAADGGLTDCVASDQ